MATICVYCGSNAGTNPLFKTAALRLGKMLAEQKHTLVYGGGSVGLMGIIADQVLACEGKVIGIIPDLFLRDEIEIAHESLTELHVVSSMHERKEMMASLSDGFIAMPGGIGTLEEIMEVFTWTQIGIHPKPCALLNVDRFYDPLMQLLCHMVENGFLHRKQVDQLIIEEDPESIVKRLVEHKPQLYNKWLDKS